MNDQGSTVAWVHTTLPRSLAKFLVLACDEFLAGSPFQFMVIPYSTMVHFNGTFSNGRYEYYVNIRYVTYLGCASAFPPLYTQPKRYLWSR